MKKWVGGILCFLSVFSSSLKGDPTTSYKQGEALSKSLKEKALNSGYLSEESVKNHIPSHTASPQNHETTMKDIVQTQLSSNRVHIDPLTDPMFINADHALQNPEESLKKQTVTSFEEKDYEEVECLDTRDEEFDIINTARIDPYYKRFEVWQFYNHCPNHLGWGKTIAQGCVTWRDRHNMRVAHNEGADFEEIHGMDWKIDKHPDFDHLLSKGKCRLKKEMPKEEGRASRMVSVEFYKKAEVYDQNDWQITPIDAYRPGRTRLKRPEDFGVESFVKTQVYTCSYQTQGNTCKAIRAQGGIEKRSTCIEKVGHVCVKWKKIYNVPKKGAHPKTTVKDTSKDHKEPFNLDARMNDKLYLGNGEAPEAISKLTAVYNIGKSMTKCETGNPNALFVFDGEDKRCVSQGGNNRCPGGHGHKEAGDLALEQKWNENKCIRVGSYEEEDKKNIGMMVGQKRTITTYCCFDSVLAKTLHQGAIAQGIKSLGDARSPNCKALTLGQVQALDWQKVDFTPFVSDMMSRVNLNASHVAQKSTTSVRTHLSNQVIAAQRAQKKGGGNP